MSKGQKLRLLNLSILVGSIGLWVAAVYFGWLDSLAFVSHISMAALVLTAISGLTAGEAAVDAES